MRALHIPLAKTGLFDKLILDFEDGNETVLKFAGLPQTTHSIFEKAANRKFSEQNRELLVNSMLWQYAGLESENSKVIANIRLLANGNVFTICTGHQLNLFTGPLYFIYKIFSTIKLTEALNAEAKAANNPQRFVPVYWMHVEDHDFDEINHFFLFGKKIEWTANSGGMAGDVSTSGLDSVLESFKSLAGNTQTASELCSLFERVYLESPNLKSAMFRLANELFAEYGLIVFNPNQAELKRLFIPQMERELEDKHNFQIVRNTNNQLEKSDYKTMVNPREINLFYVGDNYRERIVEQNGKFEVLNQNLSFSKEEILAELHVQPERFSPNVVMRPMYQETILPNVAYLGGAGELAYWMQYKDMFAQNEVSYPVLWVRNSLIWIDKATDARMLRLGIEVNALFKDIEQLIGNYVKENGESVNLNELKSELDVVLNKLILSAAALDKTLEASAKAETVKINNAIQTIEAKMVRAAKSKLEVQLNQIRKLKEKLFPDGKLQERSENFSQYYLVYGKHWFEEIYQAINPLNTELTVLIEEE